MRGIQQTFRSICMNCPPKPPRNKKQWYNAECQNARTEYRRNKGRLKRDRSNTGLQVEMAHANKAYKRAIRKANATERRNNIAKIRQLRGSSPKLYWKLLNANNKKKPKCNVPLDELFTHFKNINVAD